MEGMNTPESARAIATRQKHTEPAGTSLAQAAVNALWPWLQNRRAMMIVAAVVLAGGGLALGWDWLLAVGLAPILIAVLPCVAMGALGLCTMGKDKQSCAKSDTGDARSNVSAAADDSPRRVASEPEDVAGVRADTPTDASEPTTTTAREDESISNPERVEKV